MFEVILQKLDTRVKFGLNIVAIKRHTNVMVSLRATDEIREGDILIVIGGDKEVDRFEDYLVK